MLRFNYISMDYLEKAAGLFEFELFELQRLRQRLGKSFGEAIELLKATVDARGKIVVLGVGKSGHVGSKIAATLTSAGSRAVVLDSLNALHGDLGMVADGDTVLALSASGETEELLRILPAIARFQVKIIAICGDADSTLAKNAHVFLDVNIEQEACPLNLAPTSSTTVMLALGDALAMVLLEARGFQKEDFAKFHPAGMVGRSLLMRVHQVMRPRAALAALKGWDMTARVLQVDLQHKPRNVRARDNPSTLQRTKWPRQTISEKEWRLNTMATLPLCSKCIIALREICGRSFRRSFGISTPAKAQTCVLGPPTKWSSSISIAPPWNSATRTTMGFISWTRKRTKP